MKPVLTATQRRNVRAAFAEVRRHQAAGHAAGFRPGRRYWRRVATVVAMTMGDEAGYWNPANPNVPGSMAYPHDPGHTGTDHASVGAFQQQVPMWGPVSECQSVAPACNHFLNALGRLSATESDQAACQRVQRSAVADGSNYARQRPRALRVVRWNWRRTASVLRAKPAAHTPPAKTPGP